MTSYQQFKTPNHRALIISNLHGSYSALQTFQRLAERFPADTCLLLGDYVDGYPHGGALVTALATWCARDRQTNSTPRIIATKGNHDQMMLDAIRSQDPLSFECQAWFQNGGQATLKTMVRDQVGRSYHPAKNLVIAAQAYATELIFLDRLPVAVQLDELIGVHAGLDLNLDDPLRDTLDDDALWLRDDYLYDQVGVFARNPLPQTLVSGHTPTGLLHGSSDYGQFNGDGLACPVVISQYHDEAPRYFIDGGLHGAHNARANIVRIDTLTGRRLPLTDPTQ